MEANGGGGGLEDGGHHALPNGGGGHAPANGALANHAPANGGGVGLEDEGDHALENGGGGHALGDHAPANGALANGGGHAPANGAPANGGGNALANGVADGGDQVPAMDAVAGMGAGGAVGNGGLQVMVAPNVVVTWQEFMALYLAFLSLPAQEIARCRRVCRLWRDITEMEEFRTDHYRHPYRTPMPLFFFQDPGFAPDNLRAYDCRDRVYRTVMRFSLHHEALRIHGSCAGILLISSGDRLYACNPCTRRWANLPPLHVDNDIVGFYETGVYEDGDFGCQVLYHDGREPDCEYWIFQLGAAALPPVSIGRPTLVDNAHLDLVLANGIAPSYTIPPVYVPNFLCWLPQAAQANNDDILMFDTVGRFFFLIPPPTIQVDGEDIPVGLGGQLLVIQRQLAMTVISPEIVDVWVRSNTTTLWSCPYSIPLPVDLINLNHGEHQNGAFNAGVFAVTRDRNSLDQSPRILLAHHGTVLSRHTIEESLLLHPTILPLEGTDVVDGDPPFFQNQ